MKNDMLGLIMERDDEDNDQTPANQRLKSIKEPNKATDMNFLHT